MKKRPVGLIVFAVINFFFAGFCLLGLAIAVLAREMMAEAGVTLNAYALLSPLLTALLLIMSGIGFLKLNHDLGFVCGLLFCIASLTNIMLFNAMNGFEGFALHIPSMVYPVVLLLFLTFRYRTDFVKRTEPAE